MKRFLTVLISACLVFSSCTVAFAATSPEPETTEIVTSEPSLYDQAMDIISVIIFEGAVTDKDILSRADELYNDGYISQEVYEEIYRIVKNGLHLSEETTTKTPENEDIFNTVTEIINDSSLSFPEKITKIANLLKDLPSEEIKTILDDLKAAGVIDDETYSAISNAINGDSSNLGGIDNETGSPISGLTDLLSGLLGILGIGGSNDDNKDDTSTTKADATKTDATTSTTNSSTSTSNPKTGDYAVVSVAGVALAAGIALVLTKVKKNDKEDEE